MLENKIELMIKNTKEMNNVHGTLGDTVLKRCGALNLTLKNITADADKINVCRDILKANTGVFSNFRGYNMLNSSINLSLELSPEESIKEIITIYEKMKKHFFASSYLPLAAQIIYDARNRVNVDEAIVNTKKAYDYMKSNHFFLTSSEDVSSAAMIAVTSTDLEATFKDIEECYKILKTDSFWGGDKLQTLSHTLALFAGTPEEKCAKVIKLNNLLRKNSVPLKSYALPLLGICAFVTDDYDNFVAEMKKGNDILKNESGFGAFSIGYTVRSMIVAGLITADYIDDSNNHLINITTNSTLNILIVMLITATAVSAAAAAAAASSASSS